MAGPAPSLTPHFDRPQATVLLVACHADILELLQVALERAHLTVLVPRDAAEGLQLLLVHQPEAVVVDAGSQDSRQVEFLQAIRRRHHVLVLANDDAFELGLTPSECIRKPLSLHELLGHLEPLIREGDPQRSTNGWSLHEIAQGRIPVPGKPAVQLVVSYRTRGGDLPWTGSGFEARIADLALGCTRRVAGAAERLTHLELVVDVSSAHAANESRRSIDITALALAAGLDEKRLTQQILAEATNWVGAAQLSGMAQVRVVGSQVAAPMDLDRQELGAQSRQSVPPARVRHGPTQPLLPRHIQRRIRRQRAAPRGVFVLAVAAAGIAAFVAFPPIVGREPTISVSGAAATSVATLAATAVAKPIAAAPVPRSEARAVLNPTVGTETLVKAFPPPSSPTTTSAPLPDPTARVLDFYRLLQQGDYDAIGLILSAHMRQAVPWDPDQLRQRTPSGRLTVLRAEVVQPAPSLRDATVAIEVLEEVPPPLTTQRRYVGTWHLVRGPSGWLLDEPDIHIE